MKKASLPACVCVREGVFDKLLVACVWTFCTYSVSRDVQSCCDPYATSFPFSIRRLFKWYNFIHQTILGLQLAYLSSYMWCRQCSHSLCSHAFINFSVPSVRTKARLKGTFFSSSAPTTWNTLQQDLKQLDPAGDKLSKLILGAIEIKALETCSCFLHFNLYPLGVSHCHLNAVRTILICLSVTNCCSTVYPFRTALSWEWGLVSRWDYQYK